ncbi:MAG: MFS transporter [Anaerolineales bacterium]|nr:MFS transporter [Anaerolineales bacterium]
MLVSVAGSQMQVWALFWNIRELTEQPIALGGVGLARILPIIVFSLVGGAVADIAYRRRVLFVTQSAKALTALALAWLTLQGSITLWQIYLLTALQAVAMAFYAPSRQAMVPNLVPAKDLSNAFSLTFIAMQTGAIFCPAMSGLVIGYAGQSYMYGINAVTYLAVLQALLLMGAVAQ